MRPPYGYLFIIIIFFSPSPKCLVPARVFGCWHFAGVRMLWWWWRGWWRWGWRRRRWWRTAVRINIDRRCCACGAHTGRVYAQRRPTRLHCTERVHNSHLPRSYYLHTHTKAWVQTNTLGRFSRTATTTIININSQRWKIWLSYSYVFSKDENYRFLSVGIKW